MSNKPLVSVIMPARNVERYIARAIESMLDQTLKDFELIIIDDCSTDNTYAMAKMYQKSDKRVRLYKNKINMKIAGTLNKGIKLSKADLIARMDADDYSERDRLKLQHDYLKKRKNVAIVGGFMEMVDEKGNSLSIRRYPVKSEEMKKVMFRYSPFAHPTVMYRKEAIEEFGGYALDLFPCEDVDLWFKVGKKYKFGCVDKSLLKYTFYSDSSSHKKLKDVEMTTFKIRLDAIRKYGYKPSIYDYIYNVGQYVTIWFMPAKLRVRLYNLLRNNDLI